MTTPEDVERQHTLLTATARFDELRLRDTVAPAGGDPEPFEHAGPLSSPEPADGPAAALSRQEALELLALGEVIARKAGYGRQLAVRSARAAGASWAQIGAALGTSKQSAWEAYSRWLDAQVER
ncbi:MAG TPA: hypothetical protein VKB14_12080 [Actinomycetales bacterium]|nr:hypothetical protein [Actinomycetales bacterium]